MTKSLSDRKLGLLGFLATHNVSYVAEDGTDQNKLEQYFAIRGMYSGVCAEEGKKTLTPLLGVSTNYTFPSGPLWAQTVSYADVNEIVLDNVEGVIPDTVKETKRCALIEDPLRKDEYQVMVDFFCTTPSEYNILSLEPYGGAINEQPADATAYVHRDAYLNVFVDGFWPGDEPPTKACHKEKEEAFKWLEQFYQSDKTRNLWSNHYYQNYPNSNYPNWQEGYFGSNYPKLQAVKEKYDPENFFNYEQSIELPKTTRVSGTTQRWQCGN
jgi:hypothetical protein